MKKKSRNSSQNRYSRTHSRNNHYRNNYSRSNTNKQNYSFDISSQSHQEILHTIDIEIIPTIGTEVIQIIEISNIIIDHENIQTINQITKDPTTTIIKLDHEIVHKIGIQTIDKETNPNHLIEITHVIQILKINISVLHQNIRDK